MAGLDLRPHGRRDLLTTDAEAAHPGRLRLSPSPLNSFEAQIMKTVTLTLSGVLLATSALIAPGFAEAQTPSAPIQAPALQDPGDH